MTTFHRSCTLLTCLFLTGCEAIRQAELNIQAAREAVKTEIMNVPDVVEIANRPGAATLNVNVPPKAVNVEAPITVSPTTNVEKGAFEVRTEVKEGAFKVDNCGNIVIPPKAVNVEVVIHPKAFEGMLQFTTKPGTLQFTNTTNMEKGALGGDIPWTLVVIIIALLALYIVTKVRRSPVRTRDMEKQPPTFLERLLDAFC